MRATRRKLFPDPEDRNINNDSHSRHLEIGFTNRALLTDEVESGYARLQRNLER